MPRFLARQVLLLVCVACGYGVDADVLATDLSPSHWPADKRAAAEQAEATAPSPQTGRAVSGPSGLVVSTLSPIAALAGIETLQHGGNAADAAIATALTQITTALGTNISFAGIVEVLYYDTKTHRTYSLNAGWNAWSDEKDRAAIPLSPTLSSLSGLQNAQAAGSVAAGRRTLVPGFMAGMEALHQRFGRLKFADLFAPGIYYAENGVTISRALGAYFTAFQPYLAASQDGRRFMRQSGHDLPRLGDVFVQSDLAGTLRAVARDGAREMYSGPWARNFVAAVSEAGGKASLGDMKRYQAQWEEPASGTFQGYEISIAPTVGGRAILESLALFTNTGLASRPAYSRDADSLLGISRIFAWSMITANSPATLDAFRAAGVDVSPAGRLTPGYANGVGPAMGALFTSGMVRFAPASTPHSASVVVVDAEGNVASLVHTSNTLAWGSTGIVVGGVPIPEAAGLSAIRFPSVKPGDRVPHDMAPLILLDHGKPALAIATVGSSLVQESVQVIVDSVVNGSDLASALASPPLLLFGSQSLSGRVPTLVLQIPAGAYSDAIAAQLRERGVTVKECTPTEVTALRGTPAVARIKGGASESVEVPGVFNFAAAY